MRDGIIILVYYLCSIPYYQEVKMKQKASDKRFAFIISEIAHIRHLKNNGILSEDAANLCIDKLMTLVLYFNSSDYLALIDSDYARKYLIKTSGWKFKECA